MRQFLLYNHVLTAEEIEAHAESGVTESPPTLEQFRAQIDSYELLYKEVSELPDFKVRKLCCYYYDYWVKRKSQNLDWQWLKKINQNQGHVHWFVFPVICWIFDRWYVRCRLICFDRWCLQKNSFPLSWCFALGRGLNTSDSSKRWERIVRLVGGDWSRLVFVSLRFLDECVLHFLAVLFLIKLFKKLIYHAPE